MTFILYGATVHGYKVETDVKSTCGGTKLEFKNEDDKKILIQNLSRRKVFPSKSDALYFFI